MTKAPIVVGVTGHRDLDVGVIESGVEDALTKLRQTAPDRPMTIVSCLAEGADQLVARLAIDRHGARLVAVLPLPAAAYERDFHTDRSREELRDLLAKASEVVPPASSRSREEAYALAGRVVVERSDVIIAVWDGRPSRGPGGTSDVVALARARHLPLVWIRAEHRGAAPLNSR